MHEFVTYTQFVSVPSQLRRQWSRMHLQRYAHVPHARELWRNGAQALLCLKLDGTQILAWSMYIWKTDKEYPEFYTYTRRSERGQGHGKTVALEARKSADQLWPDRQRATFYPHSAQAQGLYRSLGYWSPETDRRLAGAT